MQWVNSSGSAGPAVTLPPHAVTVVPKQPSAHPAVAPQAVVPPQAIRMPQQPHWAATPAMSSMSPVQLAQQAAMHAAMQAGRIPASSTQAGQLSYVQLPTGAIAAVPHGMPNPPYSSYGVPRRPAPTRMDAALAHQKHMATATVDRPFPSAHAYYNKPTQHNKPTEEQIESNRAARAERDLAAAAAKAAREAERADKEAHKAARMAALEAQAAAKRAPSVLPAAKLDLKLDAQYGVRDDEGRLTVDKRTLCVHAKAKDADNVWTGEVRSPRPPAAHSHSRLFRIPLPPRTPSPQPPSEPHAFPPPGRTSPARRCFRCKRLSHSRMAHCCHPRVRPR